MGAWHPKFGEGRLGLGRCGRPHKQQGLQQWQQPGRLVHKAG